MRVRLQIIFSTQSFQIDSPPPTNRIGRGLQTQSTQLSIRAVGAVDPVAPQRPHRLSLRSPELHRRPRTAISPQRNPAPPATSPSCGLKPLPHPGDSSRSNCAAPESSATTRQGIKNTISPAGNVGERARRRLRAADSAIGVLRTSTPWLPPAPPTSPSPPTAPSFAPTGLRKKEIGDVGLKPHKDSRRTQLSGRLSRGLEQVRSEAQSLAAADICLYRPLWFQKSVLVRGRCAACAKLRSANHLHA